MIELTFKSGILNFNDLSEAVDYMALNFPDTKEWPSVIKKDGSIISRGNAVPGFITMRYVSRNAG